MTNLLVTTRIHEDGEISTVTDENGNPKDVILCIEKDENGKETTNVMHRDASPNDYEYQNKKEFVRKLKDED